MKIFNDKPNESTDEFYRRIHRFTTDKIIEDIALISKLSKEQITTILSQLPTEALEIIEEECQKLELYEVCRISRELRNL
jgi:uncharacterized protein (DUF2267 family)